MAFPSRALHLTLLAVCGLLSAQSPAPAPKLEKAAAPAPATPAPEFSPGVNMIQDLLASLGKFDQDGRPSGRKMGFEIPERALNEYLVYTLRNRPRPGITSITVALLPGNQISSDVEIDFDAVQKWKPGIFPEAVRGFLTGKRTVHADVKFEVKNGAVSFELKDATVPEGKAIVTKMMSAVMQTLGSQQPESYDTSKPIPLPFGLKRIWTDKQLICGET